MAKTRVEVCADKNMALVRQQWMQQRGYTAGEPEAQSKVIFSPHGLAAQAQIAFDDDDEVWLVIGTK